MRFARFLSGGFTTMAVINPPEKKTGKTYICALMYMILIGTIQFYDFIRSVKYGVLTDLSYDVRMLRSVVKVVTLTFILFYYSW